MDLELYTSKNSQIFFCLSNLHCLFTKTYLEYLAFLWLYLILIQSKTRMEKDMILTSTLVCGGSVGWIAAAAPVSNNT